MIHSDAPLINGNTLHGCISHGKLPIHGTPSTRACPMRNFPFTEHLARVHVSWETSLSRNTFHGCMSHGKRPVHGTPCTGAYPMGNFPFTEHLARVHIPWETSRSRNTYSTIGRHVSLCLPVTLQQIAPTNVRESATLSAIVVHVTTSGHVRRQY